MHRTGDSRSLGNTKWAILTWLGWVVVALAMGLQVLAVYRVSFGGPQEWWRPLGLQLLCYQFWWLLLTPVVLLLGRRFPLDRGRWRRNALIHGVASLAVPVMYLALCQLFVFSWLRSKRPPTAAGEWFLTIGGNIHLELLTYWSIIAIQHATRVFRERQAHQVTLARAEARASEAQLTALKMQLEPHFLFNTLNAISALIHDNPDAADAMLVGLGDFLRATLDLAPRHTVTLREELAFLEQYLAIEKARFADRLTVRIRVDERVLGARVPALILQPLVENAVRHGVARLDESGGEIDVVGDSESTGRLRLRVANTGPSCANRSAWGSASRTRRPGCSNSSAASTASTYGRRRRVASSSKC